MKNLLLTILSIFIINSGIAQEQDHHHHDHSHGTCGTHDQGPRLSKWLKAFQAMEHNEKMKSASRNDMLYIPLGIHIVGDDDGKGYYDIEDLTTSICNLNANYEQTNLFFFIEGEIDYINNSDYYDHDYTNGRSMMYNHNMDDVINVYFCRQAVEGNCGYYDYSGDAVAITNSCQMGDATTLTHELGHFLSLPHTFSGWESRSYDDETALRESRRERQDGSNCSWTGDGFCDTPPDYHSSRWTCPYAYGYVDPAGTPIETDGSLYMSYSNDACQSKFSEEQIAAMRANILQMRSELLRPNIEMDEALETVNLVFPEADAYTIPENYVVFAWDPVEGAEGYHLQVTTRFKVFGALLIDEIIYDKNYKVVTEGFEFDKSYKYRVKPISKGNMCEEFGEEREFFIYYPSENPDTTYWQIWDEDSLSSVEDLYYGSLKIYPNPSIGNYKLNVTLDNNMHGQVNIKVKDITGREVYTINENINAPNYSLDLTGMDKGLYFVELESDSRQWSNKIILQ